MHYDRKVSCTFFSLLPAISSVIYASRKGDNKGGGASAFFGNISQGIKTSFEFVESPHMIKNFSQETQEFAGEQIKNVVREIGQK